MWDLGCFGWFAVCAPVLCVDVDPCRMLVAWVAVSYALRNKRRSLQWIRAAAPVLMYFVTSFFIGLMFFATTNYPYFLWFTRSS